MNADERGSNKDGVVPGKSDRGRAASWQFSIRVYRRSSAVHILRSVQTNRRAWLESSREGIMSSISRLDSVVDQMKIPSI
jgi:hypothetical protein